MKVYRFDAGVARPIDTHESANVSISRIAHLRDGATMSCMYIGPNGLVGSHPAAVPQLFLVVQGDGWVRSEGGQRIPIQAGQAAFWESGEWHESGSEAGMTAMVIEGPHVDPSGQMQPLAS